MAGGFKWWRANKEGAVAVYRKGSLARLLLILAVCALSGVFCRLVIHNYPLFLLPLISFIPTIAENRIVIIFTPTELIYRPSIGPASRVPFTDITSMTKEEVYLWNRGRFGSVVPGLLLQVLSGQTVKMRLDVPRREEILDRLQQATGKQVN